MENKTPYPPVRSSFYKIVLTIMCIGLLISSCTSKAKITSTPLIATTGGSTTSEAAPTVSKESTGESTASKVAPTKSEEPTVVQSTLGAGIIYYVSTSGNDSNSGSATSPFKTLAKGVSVLKAGDTLYIKSGTYRLSAPLKVLASGNTTSGPITISTAPGEPTLAVISGDTNADGVGDYPTHNSYHALVELKGTYLNFKNVDLAYSGDRGIESLAAHNSISGMKVHNIWGAGIYINGTDNVIEGNTLWRTSESNYCGGTATKGCNGDWSSGIAYGYSRDTVPPGSAARIVIRKNTVYHTSGEGILCMHSDGGVIEDNVTYDNWAVNIYLDQCSYTTIQKNLVYATSDTAWWRTTSRRPSGIMVSNEGIKDSAGNFYPIGHNRKVVNNIVVGTGANFSFWPGPGVLANSALVNDLIAYNTFALGGIGISIGAGPHSNTKITNNIVYQPSGSVVSISSTAGLNFSYNVWSKTANSIVPTSTNTVVNPLLIDPNHTYTAGVLKANWYNLQSTSPAIGKGLTISGITNDYWGTLRDSNTDIGADEYKP